jgi:D-3-phosphoglycerate dehydrogenase / 2-oxoglutarate reductase
MSNKARILISESTGFSTHAAKLLRRKGTVILANLDRKELLSAIKEADVLWVRLRHQIDSKVMAAAPHLKMIVTATTGLNHIDLAEAMRRDIGVLSLRGEVDFLRDVRGTAEHTLALILALLRHLLGARQHVQSGGWDRNLFKGTELYKKTIGVVGYGRVGRIVARYLKAFDARVLISDPNVDPKSVRRDIALMSLVKLLRQADLVTLHVDLSEKTRGFFGIDQFRAMKRGASFINTSRGELVDENALLCALRSKRLSGAALDVLSNENSHSLKENALVAYARQHNNLIITPHIGGCTVESMKKTEYFLAKKLCAHWHEMKLNRSNRLRTVQLAHPVHHSSFRSVTLRLTPPSHSANLD